MSFNSTTSLRQKPPMLIVEDSNEDFEAIERYLAKSKKTIPVYRCLNGEQALEILYSEQFPHPALIVLDLNLPGTDGREVLKKIKQDDKLKHIAVVIFTTSNNPKDMDECYQYGVNNYIVKPINIEQLKQDIQTLINYWCEITKLYEDEGV